jgi:hypothetical protein
MMDFRSNLDQLAWKDILSSLPIACQDTYFTPEYHSLHVANGDGESICTTVREGNASLLVPGLRIPIPPLPNESAASLHFDIQTCNGYGGPLATPDATADFLERAWTRWRVGCCEQGIIAALFRLHPLLHNERFLPQSAPLINDRQTVFLDIDCGLGELWRKADSRYRNMVNKGRRESVQVVWNEPAAWDEMESFYRRAMQRLDAPANLRFSSAYFDALRVLPGAELAVVRHNGAMAAASVFLFGPIWCHYHVSARDPDAGNHLHSVILQSAVDRAIERGLHGLHLGGGRTNSPDDGLFCFKRSAGGELCDFKIALVVADRSRYDALCNVWQQEEGCPPSWLLGYRQPKTRSAPIGDRAFTRQGESHD